MKRKVSLALAVTMLVSLAACGSQTGQEEPEKTEGSSSSVVAEIPEQPDSKGTGGASQVEKQSDSPSTDGSESQKDYSDSTFGKYIDLDKFSEKTKKNVIDVITGDTVTVRAKGRLVIAAGLGADFEAVLIRDGDCMRTELTAAGKRAVILRNEEGTYSLDEDSKTATPYPDYSEDGLNPFYSNPAASVMISYLTSMFGMNEMKLTGTGQEEYSGSELSYEEYTAGSSVIRLYYDGDTLKSIGILKDGQQTGLDITELSPTADSGSFVIPGDYTVG